MVNQQTVNRISFLDTLRPHVSKEDLKTIEDAYTLSKYGHRNQFRDQGARYFEHPKNVALVLINELKIYDPEMIIMALLHDIIEDSFILSNHGLDKLFGERVVNGLGYLTKTNDVESYVKKMYECDDMGVIIVKFADRLHNLRDSDDIDEAKRERKFEETRKLYLPLLEKCIQSTQNEADPTALTYLKKEIAKVLAK